MCFYDQGIQECGNYKWGAFQQMCRQQYRTGRPCTKKLFFQTSRVAGKCRLCANIDRKRKWILEEEERIWRWKGESAA
jgi:hypothetical protein